VHSKHLLKEAASWQQSTHSTHTTANQQVQTLVELRAMQLEARGKMSRYSPLVALELLKFCMRLRMWAACRSHLALESVSREDRELYDSEQRLKELLGAFVRLRRRYEHPPADGSASSLPAAAAGSGKAALAAGQLAGSGSGEGGADDSDAAGAAAAAAGPREGEGDEARQERERREYNARQAAAAAVRAAAIAPDHPPCACGSSGAAMVAARSHSLSPAVSAAAEGAAAAAAAAAAEPAAAKHAAGGSVSGITDATPSSSTAAAPTVPRAFRWGWWGSSGTNNRPEADPQPPADDDGAAGAAGNAGPSSSAQGASQSLAGTWGPPLRPLSTDPQLKAAGGSSGGSFKWPWQGGSGRFFGVGGGSSGGGRSGKGGGGGGCSALEERLLQRQAGWRLDLSGMDVGDRVIWAGELMYLLRPLIYVCLLKRCALGRWRGFGCFVAVWVCGGGLAQGYRPLFVVAFVLCSSCLAPLTNLQTPPAEPLSQPRPNQQARPAQLAALGRVTGRGAALPVRAGHRPRAAAARQQPQVAAGQHALQPGAAAGADGAQVGCAVLFICLPFSLVASLEPGSPRVRDGVGSRADCV